MMNTPCTNPISNNALAIGDASAFSLVRKSAESLGKNILLATNFILSGLGVASAYMVITSCVMVGEYYSPQKYEF